MKRSANGILTSHAGSLPRPQKLIDLNRARSQGEAIGDHVFAGALADAVSEVVRRQKDAGIDIPDDGEFGKAMTASLDYGAWWNYAYARLAGFTPGDQAPQAGQRQSSVAGIGLTTFANRRDWQQFSEFYLDPDSTSLQGSVARRRGARPVCTGPISYSVQAAVQADIENLKNGLKAAGLEEGFICSISPGSFARSGDLHYKTEEEFIFAVADAMHEEYKAVVDAGLVLQIDDPSLPDNWDMINPEPPLAGFKKFSQVRTDALNHALRGLPEDRIRYHICWGSWHGPHTTDIPLADIVDLVLAVRAQAFSFEAGNVRHEHEWRVWQETKLPEGKILMPGVVSHATNVVEHPRLVADRIIRFADIVGRENVIAGTDCGLGGRIHAQIAWAKLAVLAEGAKLATRELWQ
jgi:5-methyltetrahydropteroyltriglutamate--homocysteine methyltransferase